MGRHMAIRVLVPASVLVVAAVLGTATKIGLDASQYLRSASSERGWTSAHQTDGTSMPVVDQSEGSAEAGGAVKGSAATMAVEAMAAR